MATVRMMKIDSDKMEHALQKRGLKKARVSREIGRTDSYISQICNKGEIAVATLKMLDVLYNIKADEIALDDNKAETNDKQYENTPNRELYDTIYKAITDAFVWYANQGR